MEKIVVGVDGSEQSKDALRFAVEEGKLRDLPVLAVHAWSVPAPPADVTLTTSPVDYPLLVRRFQESAERLLDRVVDDALGTEPGRARIERAAIEGPPATVLLGAALDACMLVVGSRGGGGFVKLLLGSVSEQLARHAPCPVLIHRKTDDRSELSSRGGTAA
ncbi:MAG: universal stress protein [Gaiellaceae bacterium]